MINLDNIDKKVSNNQLVCVLEYTEQKAVTKYQKDNINIVSIINKKNIFTLKYFKVFSISLNILFFVSSFVIYFFPNFIFSSSALNIFLIALDELLNLLNKVKIKYDINVEYIIIVKLLLKANKKIFFA